MMQKIKAFTLMELLIGMIVGCIIIALGYSTYTIMFNQYSSYKTIKNKVVEIMQLNNVINTDVIAADFITYSDNKLTLNKSDTLLEYYFNDSYIIRTNNIFADTFQLKTINVLVTSVDSTGLNVTDMLTNFNFDMLVLGDTEHFTFTKNYSAETLMNHELQSPKEN